MAAVDLLNYSALMQNALLGVIHNVLSKIGKSGLPGNHYLYISFSTTYPGVLISPRLLHAYPIDMTIVLQHQFWDLVVYEDHFEVKLLFDGLQEKLLIPFRSIKSFLDPSVSFLLQFELSSKENESGAVYSTDNQYTVFTGASTALMETEVPEPEDGIVVSLDRFRKKN